MPNSAVPGTGSAPSRVLCPVGRSMTEIELNERIAALLKDSERQPGCRRRTGRQYRRRKGRSKRPEQEKSVEIGQFRLHRLYGIGIFYRRTPLLWSAALPQSEEKCLLKDNVVHSWINPVSVFVQYMQIGRADSTISGKQA